MNNFWQKNTHRWLALIIGLSFFASLFYSFSYRIRPVVDAHAYDVIAQNIVAGNGFREEASGNILFDRSIQRAGPGYEYFLAGIYFVFGHHYEAVWVIQAFLHALTAWLMWLIARKLFTEKSDTIGLIGAVFVGLHPDLIEISAMIMTETLYLFLTVLFLYLFVRLYTEKAITKNTVFLAAALALGILTRPPLALFGIISVVWFLSKKYYYQCLLFLAIIGAMLTPWTVRNYQIYHQFIPTTLIGEYNLWVGNTLNADGGQLSGGYNPFDEYAAQYGYETVRIAADGAFKNFIIEHPGRFIQLTFIRTIRYFSLIRPMGFWFYQTGVGQTIFVLLSGLATAALFVTGFAGMIRMTRERKALFYCIIALALTSPLVLLPTVVQSRYRFQIYPFLAVCAGYVVIQWLKEKKWWLDRSFLIAAGILVGISIIDIFLSSQIIIERLTKLF